MVETVKRDEKGKALVTVEAAERATAALWTAFEPDLRATREAAAGLGLDAGPLAFDARSLPGDAEAVRAVRALCRAVASERAAAVLDAEAMNARIRNRKANGK